MLLFVFLALACSIEASQTYYTAAVVEYSPITDPYFNATKEVAVQIMLGKSLGVFFKDRRFLFVIH